MNGPTATPRIPANPDSDIMSEASFGESNRYSEYVESPENSPTSSYNTPELESHIT